MELGLTEELRSIDLEVRQLKNFEGWLPVLRIRMKQSENQTQKEIHTGIKSNFHDYVERTKMKDFVHSCCRYPMW